MVAELTANEKILDSERGLAEERARFRGEYLGGLEDVLARRRDAMERELAITRTGLEVAAQLEQAALREKIAGASGLQARLQQVAQEAALRKKIAGASGPERDQLQRELALQEAAPRAKIGKPGPDFDRLQRELVLLVQKHEHERTERVQQEGQRRVDLDNQEFAERLASVQRFYEAQDLLLRQSRAAHESGIEAELEQQRRKAADPGLPKAERVASEERVSALTDEIDKLQMRLGIVRGTVTLEDELAHLRRMAARPFGEESVAAIESAAARKEQDERQYFTLKRSLGEKSVADEVEFQRQIVEAHRGSVQKQLDEQIKLADKIKELRDRERNAGLGLIGQAEANIQQRFAEEGRPDEKYGVLAIQQEIARIK
ncbi:MAG: hypothetical protein ACREB3_05495, partial [Burkholderiales bacterium]